jgi:hypothetical protein
MVRSSAIVIVAAAPYLVGCGGEGPAPVESGWGHVKVIQVGAAGYTEGTDSFALLQAPDDSLAASRRIRYPDRRQVIIDRRVPSLPPHGTYILRSFQRPCDANCPMRDPPTDRCDREFALHDGERVTATVRVTPGRHCTITLRPSEIE